MYSERHIIGAMALLAIICAIVLFLGVPNSPEKMPPRDIPKELVDPCIGKEEGDSCTIEGFGGTEESHCSYLDDTLVCFPHRMPPDGGAGGGAPGMGDMQARMLEACEEKDEGDSCTIEGPMGEEEGECTPTNEGLSCILEHLN